MNIKQHITSNPRVTALVVACLALIAITAYTAITDTQEWSKFATANNCKAVGTIPGKINNAYTVAPSGRLEFKPAHTIYDCNGVNYIR